VIALEVPPISRFSLEAAAPEGRDFRPRSRKNREKCQEQLSGLRERSGRCAAVAVRAVKTTLGAERNRFGPERCQMKKVAVFGNAAGGKSTLARSVAELTRLPLYPLDTIQYERGGGKVPYEDYLRAHADLLARDQWIIDGFGDVHSAWERFAAADTLIYIDLPLLTHYRWVTKRLVKGLFVTPEGWPENSPIWRSTLDSYLVVGRCHRHLTPRYRQLVADAASTKRAHHLRSPAEMKSFLATVEREYRTGS
jgi:adenylate kinase family enzyme